MQSKEHKVVVLGNESHELCQSYISEQINGQPPVSIDGHPATINGTTLKIYDEESAGISKNPKIDKKSMQNLTKGANVFIIAYSQDNRSKTYFNLESKWLPAIEKQVQNAHFIFTEISSTKTSQRRDNTAEDVFKEILKNTNHSHQFVSCQIENETKSQPFEAAAEAAQYNTPMKALPTRGTDKTLWQKVKGLFGRSNQAAPVAPYPTVAAQTDVPTRAGRSGVQSATRTHRRTMVVAPTPSAPPLTLTPAEMEVARLQQQLAETQAKLETAEAKNSRIHSGGRHRTTMGSLSTGSSSNGSLSGSLPDYKNGATYLNQTTTPGYEQVPGQHRASGSRSTTRARRTVNYSQLLPDSNKVEVIYSEAPANDSTIDQREAGLTRPLAAEQKGHEARQRQECDYLPGRERYPEEYVSPPTPTKAQQAPTKDLHR